MGVIGHWHDGKVNDDDTRTVLLQPTPNQPTTPTCAAVHPRLTAALLATMAELDRLDEERRRRTERVTWGETPHLPQGGHPPDHHRSPGTTGCGPDLAAERTDWVDDDTMSAEETTSGSTN